MGNLNEVQINEVINLIKKKWTLDIIKNIYFGLDRFNDILKKNPYLSNKVLSQRLKEMEEDDLIVKEIISENPLVTKYILTDKALNLNKILFYINEFAHKYFKQDCDNCDKTDKVLNL